MNEEIRFLYSINPKKLIRFLNGNPIIPPIRTSKTLSLTKEEVRECLKYGSLYRRFANEGVNVRVTINNIDRLHNAKLMTEEEYKKFLEEENEKPQVESDSMNRGTVFDTEERVPEPKKETEPTPVTPVTVEKEKKVEVSNEIDETKSDSISEEPKEVSVETPNQEKRNDYSEKSYHSRKNYGGKNNKHNNRIPNQNTVTETDQE